MKKKIVEILQGLVFGLLWNAPYKILVAWSIQIILLVMLGLIYLILFKIF